jgi:sarcosine oxidase subunit gamma
MTKFSNVDVTNLSALVRFGVKGPNAKKWLNDQGIEAPEIANTWLKTAMGVLVLRLGANEFLLEDSVNGTYCAALYLRANEVLEGVYPVARFDASFSLSGPASLDLLSEVCSLDLRPSVLPSDALLMTQVAGISATILLQTFDAKPVYRIWCDGTYGEFMSDVLQEIASEVA